MMAYADRTEIAVEKSMAEITGMIRRAGARRIAQYEDESRIGIEFELSDRMIRFAVELPTMREMPTHDGRNARLTLDQQNSRLAQAERQRARALQLVIKAKLESVESKVETFEQAFLANVVMADNRTVYDRIRDPIALEYREQAPSGLLLPPPEKK